MAAGPEKVANERELNALTVPAPEPTIGQVVSRFITEVDSLVDTLPLAMRSITDAQRLAQEKVERFISDNGLERNDALGTVMIPPEHFLLFQTINRRLTRVRIANTLVPRSFLVNLVSQYDAFLGRLIRALLLARPEALNASEKTLSFSELVSFGSIEAAREHIIEKEIESVLRKSHTDQFDWLENKFNIRLRENLAVWPTFVEVTERRNLFVHTGGRVSSQYLQNCQKHKADCSNTKLGQFLQVTAPYFRRAYEAVFEIGVKLGHVFWRKLHPFELREADVHLSELTYDLLREGRYELAKVILDFATEVLKKHFSTETRLRFVINRAQAYKWSGDETRAKTILDKEDFSALSDPFKLANAVLRDDYGAAFELIRRIGKSGYPSVGQYRDWPLFKGLRKQPDFEPVMVELFGEPQKLTVKTAEAEPSPQMDSPVGNGGRIEQGLRELAPASRTASSS